jgi:anthranilate synthase/aminodeoxychorismate synthase-like glutamine amidotransferase
MFLMIDNFDSFTYNLVQYFSELGRPPAVFRNNVSLDKLFSRKKPDAVAAVVISPGPCSPKEAGNSCRAIEICAGEKIPLLGVCLGHQCIGEVFGGRIVHAPYLMHGKVSEIINDGKGVFKGIPKKFSATRYHSLLIEPSSMPDCLEISAKTQDGLIMGVRHKTLPIHGVQFHPESILTQHGKKLLSNFLEIAGMKPVRKK